MRLDKQNVPLAFFFFFFLVIETSLQPFLVKALAGGVQRSLSSLLVCLGLRVCCSPPAVYRGPRRRPRPEEAQRPNSLHEMPVPERR